LHKKLIFYTLVILLLIGLALWFYGAKRMKELHPLTLPALFTIKCLVGVLFLWIHAYLYGGGDLSNDGASFMLEGEYLHSVFYQSWVDYFKLLFGWGANETLVQKYLYMTEYWSSGNLTVINDSKNIVRIHSLIHFFSFGRVGIHVGIFCVVSIFATINTYKAIQGHSALSKNTVFWSIGLFPSVIFWTSSMLKEPFMFLGLSLALRVVFETSSTPKKIIHTCFAFILLLSFKPYILLCVLFGAFVLMVHFYLCKRTWILTAIVLIVTGIIWIIVPSNASKWTIHHLTRKQFDFINVGKGGLHVLSDTCFYYFQPHQYKNLSFQRNKVELKKPTRAFIVHFGSTKQPKPVSLQPSGEEWVISYFKPGCSSFIPITPLNDSWSQLLKNIPEALLNSIIRPYPTDSGSNLKIFSFLENILLISIVLISFAKGRELDVRQKNGIVFLLLFSITLFLLIGWITPVLGAIVRYRFPAQLCLLLCCLILTDPKKWSWNRKNMH
jgi:hypothetical protein